MSCTVLNAFVAKSKRESAVQEHPLNNWTHLLCKEQHNGSGKSGARGSPMAEIIHI